MRVAVIGASGYVGLELVRILLRHPEFELSVMTSEQRAGVAVGDAFPSLRGLVDLVFEANDPAKIIGRADLAFTALPHAASAATVVQLRAAGIPVVDTSADFRLREEATYTAAYGQHPAPELLGTAVYGMPELYRSQLPGAQLIAGPGCFPTAVLPPLVPFLREALVDPASIVVDAKTGVSGAGRKLDEKFLFAEVDDNCSAYAIGNAHRHVPEMEQEASLAAGAPVSITFTPHLLPTIRGIIATSYLRPIRPLSAADAREVLHKAYGDEQFVRILPDGEAPSLASVRGSNFIDVNVFADARTNTLIVMSAIDNLVKGASGGAVQSANVAFGFAENLGLLEAALVP